MVVVCQGEFFFARPALASWIVAQGAIASAAIVSSWDCGGHGRFVWREAARTGVRVNVVCFPLFAALYVVTK